jgi:hypothetical protein
MISRVRTLYWVAPVPVFQSFGENAFQSECPLPFCIEAINSFLERCFRELPMSVRTNYTDSGLNFMAGAAFFPSWLYPEQFSTGLDPSTAQTDRMPLFDHLFKSRLHALSAAIFPNHYKFCCWSVLLLVELSRLTCS